MAFPLICSILFESTLYDGLRHFLFLAPLLAICAAIGYHQLYLIFRKKFKSQRAMRRLQIAGLVGLLAAFIPTIHWQWLSHPNQYIYFNETIGGLPGAFGKFETDYYGNSERQAAVWLNRFIQDHPLDKKVRVCTYSSHEQIAYYLDKRRFLYNPTKLQKSTCDPFSLQNLRWQVFPKGKILKTIKVKGVPLTTVVLNEKNLAYSRALTPALFFDNRWSRPGPPRQILSVEEDNCRIYRKPYRL